MNVIKRHYLVVPVSQANSTDLNLNIRLHSNIIIIGKNTLAGSALFCAILKYKQSIGLHVHKYGLNRLSDCPQLKEPANGLSYICFIYFFDVPRFTIKRLFYRFSGE